MGNLVARLSDNICNQKLNTSSLQVRFKMQNIFSNVGRSGSATPVKEDQQMKSSCSYVLKHNQIYLQEVSGHKLVRQAGAKRQEIWRSVHRGQYLVSMRN